MRELLCEMLLQCGESGAALGAFEASRIGAPNRYRSFAGATAAAAAMGDRATARSDGEKRPAQTQAADTYRRDMAQASVPDGEVDGRVLHLACAVTGRE